MILMLSSPEPAVVVKALQALHLYMKKCTALHHTHTDAHTPHAHTSLDSAEQSCKEMAELGVVPRLVELLSSPVKAVRSYAALSLSVMTSSGSVCVCVCV